MLRPLCLGNGSLVSVRDEPLRWLRSLLPAQQPLLRAGSGHSFGIVRILPGDHPWWPRGHRGQGWDRSSSIHGEHREALAPRPGPGSHPLRQFRPAPGSERSQRVPAGPGLRVCPRAPIPLFGSAGVGARSLPRRGELEPWEQWEHPRSCTAPRIGVMNIPLH